MMDSNLRSVYLMTRAAAAELVKSKGSVVNLSSVASIRPYANLLAYCVSKAAVDQLTRCAALDMAPHGVRVNAVNPGVVVTELHTTANAVPDYAAFLERSKTTHPIGRVGEPEEIAALILFLLSDQAGWITGATYSIDGGRALTMPRPKRGGGGHGGGGVVPTVLRYAAWALAIFAVGSAFAPVSESLTRGLHTALCIFGVLEAGIAMGKGRRGAFLTYAAIAVLLNPLRPFVFAVMTWRLIHAGAGLWFAADHIGNS
jgi:hypothetical protein